MVSYSPYLNIIGLPWEELVWEMRKSTPTSASDMLKKLQGGVQAWITPDTVSKLLNYNNAGIVRYFNKT